MRDPARLRHRTISPNVRPRSGKAIRRSYSAWRLCSINGRMAAVYSNDLFKLAARVQCSGAKTTPCRRTTLPGDFLSFGGCASRSKTSSNVQRRTARQASFAAQQRSAAPKMTVENHAGPRSLRLKPAWAIAWHVWTVIIPRRSITGRLVFGQVWRRHDGRRWIYKKFIEYRIER